MSFVVLYDANVLYLSTLRDLLIRVAQAGLVQANRAVRDCLMTGYEPLVDALDLPDPDDRHVLAAAIKARAQVIVTHNLKDFPPNMLEKWDMEAKSADDFIRDQSVAALRP